jgi:dTDP-4-dehydrorhamnose 3,5-epimerase
MNFTPLEIPDVVLVEPDVFGDARGFFTETFHAAKYTAAGLPGAFVQDNFSFSRRGILRGLHFQLRQPQGKLVYAARGAIFDVAVDLRRGSPTFGRWVGRTLSGENHCQMYIPEGFAHGFCVLSDEAEVMYKCTALYDPADDRGILWNDPDVAVAWPVAQPSLSGKDQRLPRLRDLTPEQLPGPSARP